MPDHLSSKIFLYSKLENLTDGGEKLTSSGAGGDLYEICEAFRVRDELVVRHVCRLDLLGGARFNGSECDLRNVVSRRNDLLGAELRPVFAEWIPYSFLDGEGRMRGAVPELLYFLADKLNFTLEWDGRVHEAWGTRLRNGTWEGRMEDLS